MFWNKLIKLCNDNGISPSKLCGILNFSNATATKWKNGSQPRDTAIIKICDYFNLPYDYFYHNESEIFNMNFYENIKSYCEKTKKISLNEMVKILGLSTSMPTNWENGLIPNGETLIKISDYLGVSIDKLLGRNSEPVTIINYSGNERIDNIIKDLTSADVDDNDLSVIEAVLSKYKK